jgi:excisionase family DNA binding protein
MKTVLSITQAAYYLGLRERAIVELANKKTLPHRKIGKEYFFDLAELDAWWDAQSGHKIPAAFPASPNEISPVNTSPDVSIPSPIKLTRGPRTHVSAASAQEQAR